MQSSPCARSHRGQVSPLALLSFLGATVAAAPFPAGAQDEVVTTDYFEFHVDPWINLHHFLYQWSRAELGLGSGRDEVPVPERDGPQPDGRAGEAWRASVRFYVDDVGPRGHFDDAMLGLKAKLLDLDGDPNAAPPDDIPGIAHHLAAAMPVYLETWWAAHDRANRDWIAHVLDDVRRHEDRWVETVTRLFGGEWLDGPLRVDASAYANWQGGYTSNGPAHTVIWSRDAENLRGLLGLELVFHESGHMSSLGAPLRRTLGDVFGEAGVEVPGNMQHTLLFATAGELTVMIAEERGLPEHVPYIVHEGLIGFAGWAPLWPPTVEHWLPLVRGRGDRLTAMRAIAEAVR